MLRHMPCRVPRPPRAVSRVRRRADASLDVTGQLRGLLVLPRRDGAYLLDPTEHSPPWAAEA
jgi:hypothetical protein